MSRRLHTHLARLDGTLPGFRAEMAEGDILAESGHAAPRQNSSPPQERRRSRGADLTVDSPLGKLRLDTGSLPVDPKAPHRS
ncbi:hypothetical protein [Streptomyces poonensis]|uniref:Uncharacterized protein n=1 Tax=Streptomyces poonensis TaxID=68255 RepID=A0A918PM03_9ACTN|nr:hypothetical protein [Streptomyces poonensis]GGZ15541.1 hypothetical protein GCM10010365_39160 [Streptomyces poonensis]GLJ91519.1 hypothetical protein GCM10017589_41260 [Streptomyces poonensis]